MIEKLKHIHHMFYVGLFSSLFYGELSGNPHYGK